MPSRKALFRVAWLLLVASLLIPAPAGSFTAGASGISGFYVFGKAVLWSEAVPGSPASAGFWGGAVLTLAMFSNLAFLYPFYLRSDRTVSIDWKVFLVGIVLVDACVALLVPDLARLPAYWLWLIAIVLVAAGCMLPATESMANAKPPKGASAIDRGVVPPFVWVLFAFTLLWIGVSAGNHASAPAGRIEAPSGAALATYVTDHAHLLKAEQAAVLGAALQKFEAATSNQVAVAIYRHAPEGSPEAFTIGVADRSRLGRKGLDNGAVLFIFADDHVARLEVGYGLEGVLTDVTAHRLLEDNLAPAFARGEYFDGLDTTLGAVFNLVQDAYSQGRVPSASTTWWRRLKAELPKFLANAWPTLSALGLGARVAITVLGTFIVLILWSVAGQWIRLAGNVRRGIANMRGHQPFLAGMQKVDASELWDSLKMLVWSVVAIVPAAGLVVLAAGGAYGGAGASIHW